MSDGNGGNGDEMPLGSGRMRDGFDVPARVVNAVRSVRCVCGNPRLCLVTVREKSTGRTMSLGRNEAWWFTFRCLTPRCGAEHTFVYDDHTHPSYEGWQPVKAVVRADLEAVSLDADGAVKPVADLAYPAVEVAGCVVPPEFTDDPVTAPVLADWGHGASGTHLPLNPDGPGVSPPVVVDNEKAQRFQEGQFMSDLVRRATAFHGRCSVRSDEVGRECGVVKELVIELQAVNVARASAEMRAARLKSIVGRKAPAKDPDPSGIETLPIQFDDAVRAGLTGPFVIDDVGRMVGGPDAPTVSKARETLVKGYRHVMDLDRSGVTEDGRGKARDALGDMGKELVEALAVAVNAHEAAAEELDQYASVVQRGVRIPAPQLNQDPAFAAFLIGNLERERDAAVARFKKLNAAVTVKIDPEATKANVAALTDELREKLKAAVRDQFRGVGGDLPKELRPLDSEEKFIKPFPERRRSEGPFASPGPGGTEAPKPDRVKFLGVRLIHLVCGFAQHLRPADLDPRCLEMRDGGQTEAVFRFVVNGRTQVFAVAWNQDGRERSPAFHTLLACKLAAGAAADFPGATGVARNESGEFVVLQ